MGQQSNLKGLRRVFFVRVFFVLYSKQHMAATRANRYKDFIACNDIDSLLDCVLDSDDDDDDDDDDDYVSSESKSSCIYRTCRRLKSNILHVFRGVVSFTSYLKKQTNKQVGGKAS